MASTSNTKSMAAVTRICSFFTAGATLRVSGRTCSRIMSISAGSGASPPAIAATVARPRPLTGYTADRFARDMFAVADAAGADELIVVGFSMAAKFAPAMAVVDPSRVRAQVLIAPVGPDRADIPDEVFEGWMRCCPRPERVQEGASALYRSPDRGPAAGSLLRERRDRHASRTQRHQRYVFTGVSGRCRYEACAYRR